MTEDDYYKEITELQAAWNTKWRDKRRWIIVEEGDGTYSVHEHLSDGVAPPVSKPTKRDAAARLLQCLRLGPVAPQDYPEEVCIGEIEFESAEVLPFEQPDTESQILRLIRSTLDAPTFIDPTANCRNLTKTLMEIERMVNHVIQSKEK